MGEAAGRWAVVECQRFGWGEGDESGDRVRDTGHGIRGMGQGVRIQDLGARGRGLNPESPILDPSASSPLADVRLP